jgi:hypothetical protein
MKASNSEKGLTAKIFDKQCELHVIRIVFAEATPEGEGFLAWDLRAGYPEKSPS